MSAPARNATKPDPPIRLAALGLVVAVLLAWANSFSGPFVFDDRPAILANPTLDHFSTALAPPRDGGTVAGRPLVNLSLALNRAISGPEVWSYHALNLAIHGSATLVLFGLLRRTLSSFPPRLATSAAFAATLLWAVHPLQTAAVTYTIQRAESLMGLFFLLTLYGFACGRLALSFVACLAGMACKEVMAVAPLVVLLYDRSFVAGTFAAALRARRGYYAGLASTWLLLGWLVATNASRAGTAGFGRGITPADYALTQCTAIARYLRLALWPSGLVFDYGTPLADFSTAWPEVLLLMALLAGSATALWRSRAGGFLGASFFMILAPSSSLLPIATQTIAEHRMYLPLAVLTVGAALVLHRWLKQRGWLAAIALAAPLVVATHARNRAYHSVLALWSDTVAKRPDSPRARIHLGNALVQAGRTADALTQFDTALQLAPDDAEAHNDLALILTEVGRAGEALPHLEAAVRLKPGVAAAQTNLANALLRAGRGAEALASFAAAEKLAPLDAATHYNYGVALAQSRQFAPAIAHFRATLATEPSHVGARVNLANVLLLTRRTAEAITEYEAALKLRPDDPQIRANLALARQQAP